MGLNRCWFNFNCIYSMEWSLTFRGGVIWVRLRSVSLPLRDHRRPTVAYVFWQSLIEESQLLSMKLGLDKHVQVLLLEEWTCGLTCKDVL